MIQLASEATASRTSYRPVQSESTRAPVDARRSRTGHAWPFLSRYAVRPQQSGQKPAATEGGS